MSNQKGRHKSDADKRIEEIRTRIEKLLERTRKIDVELARKERNLLNQANYS